MFKETTQAKYLNVVKNHEVSAKFIQNTSHGIARSYDKFNFRAAECVFTGSNVIYKLHYRYAYPRLYQALKEVAKSTDTEIELFLNNYHDGFTHCYNKAFAYNGKSIKLWLHNAKWHFTFKVEKFKRWKQRA